MTPLHAASGVGYGEGFAANSHRYAPTGMLAAVKYLVEELGADVNAVDHEGNTALHHAASRGDNEMILYLVSKGADVKAVNREGQTTADMANGPVQRTQPYPGDDHAARDSSAPRTTTSACPASRSPTPPIQLSMKKRPGSPRGAVRLCPLMLLERQAFPKVPAAGPVGAHTARRVQPLAHSGTPAWFVPSKLLM